MKKTKSLFISKKNRVAATVGLLLLFCTPLTAQINKTVSIEFSPVFENKPLVLEQKYYSENQKSDLAFTIFKCYVSHFVFYKNKQIVFNADKTYFLLDSSKPESLKRKITIPENTTFDEIRCYLGVDDVTNNDGIGSGDLDPMKGMYWTWQTGYINMKLEGFCKNSNTNDHGFQFHLGGFLEPYVAFQPIVLKNITTENILIFIELNAFFETISLKESNTVMSPSETTVALSKKAALMFHL